jgi:hypothetical protein
VEILVGGHHRFVVGEAGGGDGCVVRAEVRLVVGAPAEELVPRLVVALEPLELALGFVADLDARTHVLLDNATALLLNQQERSTASASGGSGVEVGETVNSITHVLRPYV